MRWLKALVIGMGVVIVIGLTVVIVEVGQRARAPDPSAAYSPMPPAPPVIGAPAPAPVTAPFAAIGDVTIAIPPGATVEETDMDGARMVVRLRHPNGRAALLLIDAATGKKLGLITLDGGQKGP
jgi:hypothetical protein